MEVTGLSRRRWVRDVSFAVHEGEILGLGGLVGAGRSETVEAIFGLRPRSAGTITVGGKIVNPRKPAQAVRAGIGFVAEDRRARTSCPTCRSRRTCCWPISARIAGSASATAAGKRTSTAWASLGLPADRLLDANMLNFSGGMQQKIIIARWLLLNPKVLILDEPTKGVDIGTRQSIYQLLPTWRQKASQSSWCPPTSKN